MSREKWRIEKVMETFPGRDGRIRTVKIATKKGIINRPVQRLHLLEDHKDSIQNERKSPADSADSTRETTSTVQKDTQPQPQRTVVQRPLQPCRSQR